MNFVTPSVTLLARTHVEPEGVKTWLEILGADPSDLPVSNTPGEAVTLLAGKRCYLSFNVGLNDNLSSVRHDTSAFIANILSSRHGSVLEHVTYTFGIEGVSRVFTAEMNRHHAGWAISEGSGRFIRRHDLPVTLPESLMERDDDDDETCAKKARTRAIFTAQFDAQEDAYNELCELWKIDEQSMTMKKRITSMCRRILGQGVATGGVWTGNLRALRHVLSVRISKAAEEEICAVCLEILKIMMRCEAEIFKDFERTDDGIWTPEYWKI